MLTQAHRQEWLPPAAGDVAFSHKSDQGMSKLAPDGYPRVLAGLLSGAALVENVMAWPGLGRLILEAVQGKDLYLVMGAFVMSAVLLLLGNLAGDLLLAATDPRIKFGH